MAKRATRAQKEKRIRAVYQMLLCDTPRPDILSYCNKEWDIKAKMADNYIAAANKLIVTEAARLRENILEKHLMQRAMLRHEAFKDGDKRLVFDVLRDEAKLLNLYEKKTVPANVEIDIDWESVTDVLGVVEKAINDCVILENSLQRGRTVGYLAGIALRAFEASELEQRLAELERLTYEQSKNPLGETGKEIGKVNGNVHP